MEKAIKDLEMISYHLKDTDQLFASKLIDKCVETIKDYSNGGI